MIPRAAVLLLGLALAPAAGADRAAAQVAKVHPRDDAAGDPSLSAFRERLLRAALENDTAFVFGVVAPEVRNGFGGAPGLDAFRAYWRDRGLRSALVEALRLGGVLADDGSSFEAPYVWGLFPEGLDAFEHGVILGSGVNVRAGPGTRARVVARLSHDVVPVRDWRAVPDAAGADRRWIRVELADGREGFVAERYIRSPLEHRFAFAKRSGRWWLVWWAAGD